MLAAKTFPFFCQAVLSVALKEVAKYVLILAAKTLDVLSVALEKIRKMKPA